MQLAELLSATITFLSKSNQLSFFAFSLHLLDCHMLQKDSSLNLQLHLMQGCLELDLLFSCLCQYVYLHHIWDLLEKLGEDEEEN